MEQRFQSRQSISHWREDRFWVDIILGGNSSLGGENKTKSLPKHRQVDPRWTKM